MYELSTIMKDEDSMDSNWYAETYFYILDINGSVKFGITSNWTRRMKAYEKEIKGLVLRVLKQELYNTRWEAELLEQIIKWRLRPWVFEGRHEWINAPIQMIVDCYVDTRNAMIPEINKYEYIHKTGKNRWSFYRQIADISFHKN
jgi:hypothetical protein